MEEVELEEVLDMALDIEIKEREDRFICEAEEEWDKLSGRLPSFGSFIKLFTQLKWEEYAKRN